MNKREGGSWKSLKFIKPSGRSIVSAILIPTLIIMLLLFTGIYFGHRTKPDWDLIRPLPFYLYNISLLFGYVFLEEIGWRGYLQENLIKAFGALRGILVLGIVWGLWHLPVIIFSGRNFPNHPVLEALLWYPIGNIALSFVIAYLGFRKYPIYIGIIVHMIVNINGYFIGPLMRDNLDETTRFISSTIVYILITAIFATALWLKGKRYTAVH